MLKKQFTLHKTARCLVFLTVVILSSVGQCLANDTKNVTGIWRGRLAIWRGTTTASTGIEMRLQQNNNQVTGTMTLGYQSKFWSYDISGTFDGKNFRAKTLNSKIQKPDNFLSGCNQLELDFLFEDLPKAEDEGATIFHLPNAKLKSYLYDEIYYTAGDVMDGGLKSASGECNTFIGDLNGTRLSGVGLTRQYESIVVMFGGFADSGFGPLNSYAVKKYVYEEYLNTQQPFGQIVGYFQFSEDILAKRFIYRQLIANPAANVVIIGHSLGGEAAFTLARKLEQELPKLKISLVATLDSFTQFDKDVKKTQKEKEKSLLVKQLRPGNIQEWINIYCEHNKKNRDDMFAINGGVPWKIQQSADKNLFFSGTHGQAAGMFFTNLSGIIISHKVKNTSSTNNAQAYDDLLPVLWSLKEKEEFVTPKE